MNIQKLEKATKLLNEIKKLDKDILQIDAFAMMVANEDVKINVKIEVPISKPKEAEKVPFDEDGSLISEQIKGLTGYVFNWYDRAKKETDKDDKQTLSVEVGNNISLQLLGVLLCEKQGMRANLLERIALMGITI